MLRRINAYLMSLFPFAFILEGILWSGVFFISLAMLNQDLLRPSAPLLFSIATVPLYFLLLRVMDDLKDEESDRWLFPERPLPQGKVHKEDLKFFSKLILGAILVVNAWNIFLLAFSALILLYSSLMYRWFFIEGFLKKSPFWTLLTHQPIIYLILTYLYLAYNISYDVKNLGPYMMIPLGLIVTNWEISRKIRSPLQEGAHLTYSKVWGPRVAAFLTLLCQGAIFWGIHSYLDIINSPTWFLQLSQVLMGLTLLPAFIFFLRAKFFYSLKRNAEIQALLIPAIIVADFLLFRVKIVSF